MPRFFFMVSLCLAQLIQAQPLVPAWSPERIVMPPAVHQGSGGAWPSIASDGRNFLVVSAQQNLLWSIEPLAMLVDPDGRPLLPSSLVFGSSSGTNAGVAWSGRRYLMAWGGHGAMFFALIDPEGRLLTSPSIKVFEATREKGFRSDFYGNRPVAWNGREFIVLTDDRKLENGEFTLAASRISEMGDIVQKEIPLGKRSAMDIASAHGTTVVVSLASTGLELQTIGTTGGVSDATMIGDFGFPAAIASGDDGFEVVWTGRGVDHYTTDTLHAQHLDFAGRPVGQARTYTNSRGAVDVTWAGNGYLVTWTEDFEVRTALLNGENLTHIENGIARDELRTRSAAVAWNGTTTLLAWDGAGVYARQPAASAAAQPVHRVPRSQFSPVAAVTSNSVDVAWIDQGVLARRGGDVVRLSSNQCSVDPIITAGPTSSLVAWAEGCQGVVRASTSDMSHTLVLGAGGSPRAVWTGTDFMVVFRSGDAIRYARVSADGNLTQPATGISPVKSDFAIGVSDTSVLIVWNGGGALLKEGTVTSTDAIVTDEDLPISISIASDGIDFFVTWIHHGWFPNDYIAGRLVSAEGKALTNFAIYSDGGDYKLNARTFWTGNNYLTVWPRPTDGYSSESQLWAFRVGRDGKLLDYPSVQIGLVKGAVSSWDFNGDLVVTYTRYATGAIAGVVQSFYRVTSNPRFRAARMQ